MADIDVIVTGGAGFIGSNIIKGLNEEGIQNILIVDDAYDTLKLRNLNSVYISDYVDKEDFILNLEKYKNVKAIIHQGACSSTTETDGKFLMKNNYEYSKKLLEFSIKNSIKFIYASSASVYGDGKEGFYEDRICENPLNGYASSKFLFDNYVRNILNKGDYNSTIVGLRYFNVFGYQENHKGDMSSVFLKFFNQVTENKEISIFEGSKDILRDFIFIEDVVKVVLYFFKNTVSGIFNCGTGKARSFYDIAKNYHESFEGVTIKEISFPDKLKNKYQYFTQADISNLRNAGYSDEFMSLEEGLNKYVRNLKDKGGYL